MQSIAHSRYSQDEAHRDQSERALDSSCNYKSSFSERPQERKSASSIGMALLLPLCIRYALLVVGVILCFVVAAFSRLVPPNLPATCSLGSLEIETDNIHFISEYDYGDDDRHPHYIGHLIATHR